MKYRKLGDNELVCAGDHYSSTGRGDDLDENSGVGSSYVGRRQDEWTPETAWYRPVKEDNWIAFSDRKPTKEDADGMNRIAVRSISGAIDIRNLGTVGENLEWQPTSKSYWMPLNFIPREPTRIKVDGHEVVPGKDGSIKVGCQTVSSQDFEEIIRQRTEAMR